jgi:alpha-glucosidase
MRRVVDAYPERVLIGEIYLPIERLVRYYGEDLSGVHLPFNFQLILAQWDARHLARLIDEYEAALPQGGWPNWVLGNHDRHRIASRVGLAQARVAAMLLLTLRGTPTIYQGDELGMTDVEIPTTRIRDPLERNVPGRGLGRDPVRTPMQWDDSVNAGFTRGDPWLPVADDFDINNVEREIADPHSMLTLYRKLLALRRGELALEVGSFEAVTAQGDALAYIRRSPGGGSDFLIALNLGDEPHHLSRSSSEPIGEVVLSTYLDREGEPVEGEIHLRGDEGLVIRLGANHD